MFTIGQKVVCVNGDFSNLQTDNPIRFPKKDRTYTIRAFSNIGGPGILLEEIINDDYCFVKHNYIIAEPSFSISRFVPLQADFVKITFEKVMEEVETSAN